MVNLICLLSVFVFSSTVFGGVASSRVNLSEGTLDDNFVLSVEVEGSAISTPQVPDTYKGMTFQSMGKSSSFSNINGVTKNLVTFNYQINFEKTGTFTVPSIIVKVDDVFTKTMPIKLKVLAPSNAIADASGKKLPPIYIERTFDKKEVLFG